MENNKYYIPKIEEFHIGFEYEYHEHFGKDFGKWNKYTIENNTIISNISELIASGSIRVKYLDKEDIESLGFTFGFEEGNGVKYGTYKDNSDIHINWDGDSVNPTNRFELIWIIKTSIPNHAYNKSDLMYDHYTKASFKGIIKNKSELKKLLTQLGIEYASKSN